MAGVPGKTLRGKRFCGLDVVFGLTVHSTLRAKKVLRTRNAGEMPVLKYDIARPLSEGGGYEVHYWRETNRPTLDRAGYVSCIVNLAEDGTEGVRLGVIRYQHDV
jgi:hypothetical protein